MVTQRSVAMIHCPLYTPPTSAWLTNWVPPVRPERTLQYVVFPALDMVLTIAFFGKSALAYFDYKKHGQFVQV